MGAKPARARSCFWLYVCGGAATALWMIVSHGAG